jgi:flagellar biosynthesis component FlhA
MKKILLIVDTAPTKKMAIDALETLRIFGNITENDYQKGRKLITKEFK